MALQNLPCPIMYPTVIAVEEHGGYTGGGSNHAFNATTTKFAYCYEAPVTDTITELYFRTGTVTTGTTVRFSVQTCGTDGRPSGTLWAANTEGTVAIADANDNVWKTVTLTASASVTAGNKVAIVFEYSSGAVPSLNITGLQSGLFDDCPHWPLRFTDTGAGWATWSTSSPICWIIKYGTAGIIFHSSLTPLDPSITVTSFDNATATHERGTKFTVPMKCRVRGFKVLLGNFDAGADYTHTLWPASSTGDGDALRQGTCDGDIVYSTTEDGYRIHMFSSPYELAVGTTYYIGIRADTANNIGIYEGTFSGVTGQSGGLPGGSTWFTVTRTWAAGVGSAWTEDAARTPFINLIIDQLDDGVGGGGVSGHVIGS